MKTVSYSKCTPLGFWFLLVLLLMMMYRILGVYFAAGVVCLQFVACDDRSELLRISKN